MTAVLDLDKLVLKAGGHDNRRQGVCLLEAVAWAAGQKHSDSPPCVSAVLRRFGMRFNDRLRDGERQALKRFVPEQILDGDGKPTGDVQCQCGVPGCRGPIGTAGDGHDDKRVALATEWLFRTALPEWLDLAGLDELAAEARAVPSDVGAKGVREALWSLREKTWAVRSKRREALRERVRAELAKRPAAADADAAADAAAVAVAAAAAAADADAAAAADAVAAAVAAAAADAVAAAAAAADAAAVADAAAAAAADADAAAVADAVAAAVAAAAAAAVAVADAAADAAAAAVAAAAADAAAAAAADAAGYWPAYYAAKKVFLKAYEESPVYAEIRALRDRQIAELVDLYDRMIHVGQTA